MDQAQACGTSVAGTCWPVWASWAKGHVSTLYHSRTQMEGNLEGVNIEII